MVGLLRSVRDGLPLFGTYILFAGWMFLISQLDGIDLGLYSSKSNESRTNLAVSCLLNERGLPPCQRHLYLVPSSKKASHDTSVAIVSGETEQRRPPPI